MDASRLDLVASLQLLQHPIREQQPLQSVVVCVPWCGEERRSSLLRLCSYGRPRDHRQCQRLAPRNPTHELRFELRAHHTMSCLHVRRSRTASSSSGVLSARETPVGDGAFVLNAEPAHAASAGRVMCGLASRCWRSSSFCCTVRRVRLVGPGMCVRAVLWCECVVQRYWCERDWCACGLRQPLMLKMRTYRFDRVIMRPQCANGNGVCASTYQTMNCTILGNKICVGV